jgi:hypothetical protein
MYPVTNNIYHDKGYSDEENYREEKRRDINWNITEQLEDWILQVMYVFCSTALLTWRRG